MDTTDTQIDMLEPSPETAGESSSTSTKLADELAPNLHNDVKDTLAKLLAGYKPPEGFEWFDNDEDIIVERQQSIAVYRNKRNHVVVRAEGDRDDDDICIFLSTDDAIRALIKALERELDGG